MIVDSAVYVNGHRHAGDIPLEETYEASRKPGCFAWIGLHEPTEEEFEAVRREFGLHELAVEDAVKAHQRPKLEVYGETLLHRPQDGRVRGGSRSVRRDPPLCRGGIHRLRAPRRLPPARGPDRDGATAGLARSRPRSRGLRDRRPRRGRIRPGHRGARHGHPGSRDRGLLTGSGEPGPADLPSQSVGAPALPGSDAASPID